MPSPLPSTGLFVRIYQRVVNSQNKPIRQSFRRIFVNGFLTQKYIGTYVNGIIQ